MAIKKKIVFCCEQMDDNEKKGIIVVLEGKNVPILMAAPFKGIVLPILIGFCPWCGEKIEVI